MISNFINKAIFLDRDGTINFDYSHVYEPDKLRLLPKVSEAISKLKNHGFLIIIISNQSCIGRGIASPEQVEQTNEKLKKLLIEENLEAKIDDIFIAPDHPNQATIRRKPNPGMIIEAKEKYLLDLNQCWVIGDKISDPQTGVTAGIPLNQCYLVKPNQMEEIPDLKDFQCFNDLYEATKNIITK